MFPVTFFISFFRVFFFCVKAFDAHNRLDSRQFLNKIKVLLYGKIVLIKKTGLHNDITVRLSNMLINISEKADVGWSSKYM